MGLKKTPSEVYADAWDKYRFRCRRDGVIALNQYCRSIGMKEQRLYEWLRRRKISVSEFQESCGAESGRSPAAEETGFCEVKVERGPDNGAGSDASGRKGEVCVELRSGDVVRMTGLSVREVADLMITLNRAADVGA